MIETLASQVGEHLSPPECVCASHSCFAMLYSGSERDKQYVGDDADAYLSKYQY